MGSCHAIAAIILAGCGRIGFESVEADAAVAISIEMPSGGTIRKVTSGPDGTWYATSEAGQGYRSDDGQRWFECGSRHLTGIAVDGNGVVYGSGSDVGISTDRCATWTASAIDRYTLHVASDGVDVFALSDRGLRRRTGTSWTPISTPLDGSSMVSFAGRPGTARVAAVFNAGLVVSPTGMTWTAVPTGFPNRAFTQVATSPTRLYAISGGGVPMGGIACSDGTGQTWTTCLPLPGLAIAVDPLNDVHVVAGIYDNLGETFDAFQSVALNLRENVGLDAANIYDLHYLPSGDLLSASTRGVFFSPAGPLAFQPRTTGLTAWNVYAIFRDGSDVFVGTEGGVLRSPAGAPYMLSTTGMRFSTRSRRLLRAPDGSLIAAGRSLWRSVDDGVTWETLDTVGIDDGYNTEAIALVGTRIYAGTYRRVLYADPPWTSWTPVLVGDAVRSVEAIVPVGAELWVATDNGLFKTTDPTVTYTPVAASTVRCHALLALSDGALAAGCDDGVWISDVTRTNWQQRGLATVHINALYATTTLLIAATSSGLHATSDRGGTWTELAGTEGLDLWAVIQDPADGSLVYGGIGTSLRRATLP